MKPINTALCSFGMSGLLFHAPFVNTNKGFNLYGVLERTKNLAQEKYSKIKTFRTLESLLKDDNIELVILNTPNITHYNFAKQIIQSGKHLVVEKPFTTSAEEADELIQLAKVNNVKMAVFHNRRWDSDFLTVKKIVDNNTLGDIVEAEFHYDRFDPELSYKVHKETPTEGVGSLYDLGSHIIDQALVLFGKPKAVFANIDSFREQSKVADYFDVKLFYSNHKVTLKSSYFVKQPIPSYVIHGKKGSFLKSKADVQEAELQRGISPDVKNCGIEPASEQGLLHTQKENVSVKEYITSEAGNYMVFYDKIYESIRNDKPLPVSAEEGKAVIEIIEAALKSNTERRIIDL
ncbi:oxidoreductase [Meridianimaribacter sp. CL38]|uniref:Gfo/Idh/MocA family oxidoreductase n=1 Tax=Meridianimaribacter sp. CL38 TaxID=2213021 RepID=UPI00103A2F07|nr:Gfo/Idh/MocA family oxidoreductase [Meridianimaribacter sp. CL38]TBV27638.1 oxidoreductase [Meridianimaribacter sp. CL38]